MVEAVAGKRPLTCKMINLCEKAYRNHLFSFKSNLLREFYKHFEISFGTKTLKYDLLQKITEIVVECSCVVKKIVGKDASRRKTALPRPVCTLSLITHFSSAAYCEYKNLKIWRY